MIGGIEFIAFLIIIAQQILRAAHVAKEYQNMTITNRPKIRTGSIITDQRKSIVFYKFMQIFPVNEIFRTKQRAGTDRFSSRSFIN